MDQNRIERGQDGIWRAFWDGICLAEGRTRDEAVANGIAALKQELLRRSQTEPKP